MNRKDIQLKVGDEVVYQDHVFTSSVKITEMHKNAFACEESDTTVIGAIDGLIPRITSINGEPVTDLPTLIDEMADLFRALLARGHNYTEIQELLSRYDSERKQ